MVSAARPAARAALPEEEDPARLICVKDTSGESLPFDEALSRDAAAFFRIFSALSPARRAGLERMREVYHRVRMQEASLSVLYKQAAQLCQDSTDTAFEIRALQKFIPQFSTELHHHMAATNKAMQEGRWGNVEAHVKSTQDILEVLVGKMEDTERALRQIRDAAGALKEQSSRAVEACGAPVCQYALAGSIAMLGVIEVFLISSGKAAASWLDCMPDCLQGLGRVGLPGPRAIYGLFHAGAAAIAATQGAATAGAFVASCVVGGAFILAAAGCVAFSAYAAYCLAASAKNFLTRLQRYERERLGEIEASAAMIRTHSERSEGEASEALERLERERRMLQKAMAEISQLQDLARSYARSKEHSASMDEAAAMQEMQRCRDTFEEYWRELALDERSAALETIMPEMRAMNTLLDSIEPRPLESVREDEVALWLSRYARDGTPGPDAPGHLEVRGLRRHSSPAGGMLSHIVVAEVHDTRGTDHSGYPALFVAIQGSGDVGQAIDAGCAPNWDALAEAAGGSGGVALHRGYHAEVDAAYAFLLQAIVEASGGCSAPRRVVFCGHSHGAALAQMAVVRNFVERDVHGWRHLDELTASMPEDRRAHLRALLGGASAVCFASPQVLGFGGPCALADALADFMYERVVNYCWRCDPVPRCFSHVDVGRLQGHLRSASYASWLLGGPALQSLEANIEALRAFRHVSKNILLCDLDQQPEKWGGTWEGCAYDLGDHDAAAYAEALRRFRVRDTALKAFVLKDGDPHQVLWQTRG